MLLPFLLKYANCHYISYWQWVYVQATTVSILMSSQHHRSIALTTEPQTLLLIEQSNCSNRTSTPTPQLQRKPNKSEPALTNNTIQIIKTLHMCHLPLSTNIVRMEIHLALRARTNRFNPCNTLA
jgi:hypothetical protein